MPEAAAHLARVVELVARLSRRRAAGEEGMPIAAVAAELGSRPSDVTADIRTLTTLNDHAEHEWLLSLSAWQQDDRVSVSSAGPFRRPVRLTPEEFAAVQVALAGERGGPALAARLARALAPSRPTPAGEPAVALAIGAPHDVRDLLGVAVRDGRRVALLYAGETDRAGRTWLVEPHQLAEVRGRTYLVAWCADTSDWRHFRLDRMLDALPAEGAFTRRPDFRAIEGPEDVFRAAAHQVEAVTVRFSARVARWVRERYGNVEDLGDGAVAVRLPATSMQWLVRRVLEYGDDAEVIGPAAYREAVRRAVA
jgi:predicted DNA-binding transcriptional regulator YafY